MTSVRPVLIIGANGQIGSALITQYETQEQTQKGPQKESQMGPMIGLTRAQLDLENASEIRQLIRQYVPAAIINAAAYTAVDRAESDRARCFSANAEAPVVVAEEAARIGSLLIHYSTDYVFDGLKGRPYVETDATAPLSVYGESKAAADQGIASVGGRYVILRTSWVFSPNGSNFVRTILRLAAGRDELRVVEDQIGSPTSARFVARVTLEILRREIEQVVLERTESGVYHLAAAGATSWCGFARQILDRTRNPGRVVKTVVPISSKELNACARRPAYSVLQSSKLRAALGLSIPTWEEQLDEVIAELALGNDKPDRPR